MDGCALEVFPILTSDTFQPSRLSFVFLLLHSLSVDSFSRGSPESACEEDMRPRHGFATQVPFPRNWLILSSFLWFNMHDQTLSLNFGENGLSTWRVIYLANTSSWSEIFASICFPASLGNSPNMLAFLILSDDWDINRLGGGDDLSFVFTS